MITDLKIYVIRVELLGNPVRHVYCGEEFWCETPRDAIWYESINDAEIACQTTWKNYRTEIYRIDATLTKCQR
jgi:hypothetical protein